MTHAKSDLPLAAAAPAPYYRLYSIAFIFSSFSWRDTVFTVASLRASSVLNLEALPRPRATYTPSAPPPALPDALVRRLTEASREDWPQGPASSL